MEKKNYSFDLVANTAHATHNISHTIFVTTAYNPWMYQTIFQRLAVFHVNETDEVKHLILFKISVFSLFISIKSILKHINNFNILIILKTI